MELGAPRAPPKAARDHQVEHEEDSVGLLPHDPLAEPSQADDRLPFAARQGWVDGPKQEPYGALVTYVWDPSGILLHLAEWTDDD